MSKVLLGLSLIMTFSSLSYANQYCYTSPDGIMICSNSNGSWGG